MALRVVALRAAGVGDLLTAVPALRALTRVGTQVTVAAPDWLHPLALRIPGVHSAVGVDGLRPKCSLRGVLAVNLHGRGPQSHEALLAGSPDELLAFRCPGIWQAGPLWDGPPRESERARWCRLLEAAGIAADENDVHILAPHQRAPMSAAVVLHVGGKDPARRWPARRFAQLVHELGIDTSLIAITGDRRDLADARIVAEDLGLAPHHILAGQLSIEQWAAMIAEARLVVTGDTGAAHLSTAYDVRSVVVFGPALIEQWGPPRGGRQVAVRASGHTPAAADVPVDDVMAAVKDLWEAA
jgi:ADP-heptose:LPS heptosyltransferase